MSLESIYADFGASIFPEPIHDYFPNTQGGQTLTDVTWSTAHSTLASEINVKHVWSLQLLLQACTRGAPLQRGHELAALHPGRTRSLHAHLRRRSQLRSSSAVQRPGS